MELRLSARGRAGAREARRDAPARARAHRAGAGAPLRRGAEERRVAGRRSVHVDEQSRLLRKNADDARDPLPQDRRSRSPAMGRRGRRRARPRTSALVRHKAIGLNYIDTYHRSGLYPCRCRRASASRPRAWWKRSARASPISRWATASPTATARSARTPS